MAVSNNDLFFTAKGDNPPEGYELLKAGEAVKSGDLKLCEASTFSFTQHPKQWSKLIDVGSGYKPESGALFARKCS